MYDVKGHKKVPATRDTSEEWSSHITNLTSRLHSLKKFEKPNALRIESRSFLATTK